MFYCKIYVLLLEVLIAVFASTDYCDPNLCDKGQRHIGCVNNGYFSRICNLPEVINVTPNYRKVIVRKHNMLRNKIARGFKNFPPAQRMATMVWDDELAKLAELNVKKCKVRHDKCRNTIQFPSVGQNLGSTRWKEMYLNEIEVTMNQIQEWFDEYKNCPLHVITGYTSVNGPDYGRFTTMMQDKSTHIGCAILRSSTAGYTQQLLTCNYAYDNMLGAPVYSVGETASQCTTGPDSRYTSLCSILENYS